MSKNEQPYRGQNALSSYTIHTSTADSPDDGDGGRRDVVLVKVPQSEQEVGIRQQGLKKKRARADMLGERCQWMNNLC